MKKILQYSEIFSEEIKEIRLDRNREIFILFSRNIIFTSHQQFKLTFYLQQNNGLMMDNIKK